MYRILQSYVHSFFSLRLLASFIVISFSISLFACEKNDNLPPLLVGSQTISGIVKSAGLSLLRRGTHILYQDSIIHTYLESSSINLSQYEGKYVVLSGTYERNDDSPIPIFVVDEMIKSDDTIKNWDIPSLNIALSAPVSWEKKTAFGKVMFTPEDGVNSVVSISKESLPKDELPNGEAMAIAGRPAVRQIDDRLGTQSIFVFLDSDMLIITFNPDASKEPDILKIQWTEMLSSIVFTSSLSSVSTVGSGSVSIGSPCGGSAGILCPKGQYCEISNMDENIGNCRSI